jgi:hypothetical protein
VTALVVVALVVALAFVVGSLVRGVFLGYPAPLLEDAAVLSRKEQAIVAAVADALFPPGGPIPLSGTEAGLVRYMDQALAQYPRHTLFLTRLLFAFLEHGPWIFGFSPRFTRLSREQRVRAMDRMAKSPVYLRRIAFLSIRMLMCMGYLANDDVKRSIGLAYERAPFDAKRGRPPAFGARSEAIA